MFFYVRNGWCAKRRGKTWSLTEVLPSENWALKTELHRQRKKAFAKESKDSLNQNLFRRPNFILFWTKMPDSVLGISFQDCFSGLSHSFFYYSISFLKQLLLNNWLKAISKGHLIHCFLFWLKPLCSNTEIWVSQTDNSLAVTRGKVRRRGGR